MIDANTAWGTGVFAVIVVSLLSGFISAGIMYGRGGKDTIAEFRRAESNGKSLKEALDEIDKP